VEGTPLETVEYWCLHITSIFRESWKESVSVNYAYMPKARTRKTEIVEGRRDGRANDKEVEEEETGITEEVETKNREKKTA
jgi:hypothetical protein